MNEVNIQEILENFKKGRYSRNEYRLIREWFTHPEQYPEVNRMWMDEMQSLAEKGEAGHDLEPVFRRIIAQTKGEIINNKWQLYPLWQMYSRIAAVLFIPLLAVSLYYIFGKTDNHGNAEIVSMAEIYAPEGSRVEFLLPDSTTGWLNSGSQLRYPVEFEKERRVSLSGEAFFNVKKRNGETFFVDVTDMGIKVLGTKFNISAYENDKVTEVVLTEGRVEVTGKTGTYSQVLAPDEKLSFSRENKTVTLSGVDAGRVSSWKDGYLVIDNEPLEEVVSRMERWYNAEIIILDEALRKYRFRATFRDEPLEEVLRLIAITTPIQYHIEKRETDEAGVVKKRIATLKMR